MNLAESSLNSAEARDYAQKVVESARSVAQELQLGKDLT
jgi:hypothetical protein